MPNSQCWPAMQCWHEYTLALPLLSIAMALRSVIADAHMRINDCNSLQCGPLHAPMHASSRTALWRACARRWTWELGWCSSSSTKPSCAGLLTQQIEQLLCTAIRLLLSSPSLSSPSLGLPSHGHRSTQGSSSHLRAGPQMRAFGPKLRL